MYRPKSKGEKIVLKEYENGIIAVKELSKRTNYSVGTIYTYLCNLGKTIKRNLEINGSHICERTKKIKDLLAKGVRQIEVARIMGVSRQRVGQIKKEYDL